MDYLIHFFYVTKNFVISLFEKVKRYMFSINKIYSLHDSKINDLYYEYVTMFVSSDDYGYFKIFVEYDGLNRFFRTVTKNKTLQEIKNMLSLLERDNSYNKIILGIDNDILINKIIINNQNVISIFSNYVSYDYVPTVKDILDINEINYTEETKINIDYIKDFTEFSKVFNINNLINMNINEIEKILLE